MALTVSIGLVQQSSWTNVPDGAISFTIAGGTGPYTVYLLDLNFATVQTQTISLGSGTFSGLYSNQPNSNIVGSYYILAFDSLGDYNDYTNVISTLTYITCSQVAPYFGGSGVLPTCLDQTLSIDYIVDTTSNGYTLDVHLAYWDGVNGSALVDIDDFLSLIHI